MLPTRRGAPSPRLRRTASGNSIFSYDGRRSSTSNFFHEPDDKKCSWCKIGTLVGIIIVAIILTTFFLTGGPQSTNSIVEPPSMKRKSVSFHSPKRPGHPRKDKGRDEWDMVAKGSPQTDHHKVLTPISYDMAAYIGNTSS